MDTGKTAKYLKYAIGEIVLVVIGILIALQVNNNEFKKQKIKEKELLTYVLENLKKDSLTIERVKATQTEIIEVHKNHKY